MTDHAGGIDPVTLAHDDLEPLVGETFTVGPPDRAAGVLRLASVSVTGTPWQDGARVPFMAVLHLVEGEPFGQGLVELHHETAGPLDLFLVPAEPAPGDPPTYVASFN